MKFILRLVLLFLTIPFLSFAQNGGTTIPLGASEHTVPDNPSGNLDVNNEHTIQLWFKANNVIPDQKLFSKITDEFQSGYILGIQNGTIKYELFSALSEQQELIAGSVENNQWTHLAVTYVYGDKLKMYINGELVGEISEDEAGFNYNTNDLVIGSASWDPGTLDYGGEIDELSFWNVALTQETIVEWMFKSANLEGHPDVDDLALYHKYDTGSGTEIIDHSMGGNGATTVFDNWIDSTVPFKGEPYFFNVGPPIEGVWVGHETCTVGDLVTVTATGFIWDESLLIESPEEGTPGGLCTYPIPASVDESSCIGWHVLSQHNPNVAFSFDLTNYDLIDKEVVLMASTDIADFTDATIYSGTLTGSTFEVPAQDILEDDLFYALGFSSTPVSAKDLSAQNIAFEVTPNPSNGQFMINIESAEQNDFQLEIMDPSGKVILTQPITSTDKLYQEQFDFSDLPVGLYFIQLSNADGITTRKLVIE